ncbi:unnamed protein product [Trifolium pratense]|uniref:Uncharacterized protein n=1 Tax=Trifolium pratense TaxID=57577 RepID=A0ACB0KZV0_TRIPR|nr:unnamed protein product [Trifolium pratense]
MAADQTVKEWQSFSVSVPVKATINDIIVLSDSDEEDVNIEVTSAGRKEVESPDNNIWHCSGICGSGTRRPVSLSALKRWSESEFDSSYSHLEFKTLNSSNRGLPQPSNIISDADVECRNQSANMAADQTVKEWQSVSVSVPVKATINDIIVLSDSDEEDVNIEVTSAGRNEVESPDINIFHCSVIYGSGTRRNQSANMAADQTVNDWQSVSVYVPVKVTINDIIVLSDSDEEDVNIEVTSAGRKEVESPDINIWHCSGICVSGTRRPVSLSALKR